MKQRGAGRWVADERGAFDPDAAPARGRDPVEVRYPLADRLSEK